MTPGIKIGDSKVLESREAMDGTMIRRRRVTSDGKIRFTTYERIEMPTIMVRKRSGNREEFDRDKLLKSVRQSVGKFFNSPMEVEGVVDQVVNRIYDLGEDVVDSRKIGDMMLDVLAEVNEVAYVRFASVFQEFKTLSEFEQIIKKQKQKKDGERKNSAGSAK